jgi:hypothetical protein
MYQYSQKNHTISFNDKLITSDCYSGNGIGLNNPDNEKLPNVGCLPKGLYYMAEAIDSPDTGIISIPLYPLNRSVMYGRSNFFIHGDNPQQNFTASKGCIIAPHAIRLSINFGYDRLLNVIA